MLKHLWHAHFVRIISLCSIAVIGVVSSTIYIPSFPAIQSEFATIPSMLQLSMAVFFLTSSLGQLIIGPISDVRGRVGILRLSLVGYTIVTFMTYFSTSIDMLIACRALQGLFASAGLVLMRSISRDLFQGPDLTRALALVVGVISIMPAVGPGLGGLFDSIWGWRSSFLFLTVFGGYLTFLAYMVMQETNVHKTNDRVNIKNTLRNYQILLKSKIFCSYLLVPMGFFGGLLSFGVSSGYIFMGYFGWPSYHYALVGVVMAMGNILGSAITHRFASHLDRNDAILYGISFAVVSLLVMAALNYHHATEVGLLVPVFFFLAGGSIASANADAEVMELYPKLSGTASALLGSSQLLMGAIVSVGSSVTLNHPFYVILLMMGATCLMLLPYLFVIRKHRLQKL